MSTALRTLRLSTILAALTLGISVLLRGLVSIRVAKRFRRARRTVNRAASATAKHYVLAMIDGCKDLAHRLKQPHTGTRGWIGVDLDGTLAEYHGWKGIEHIGSPVPAMLARVKTWLEQGIEVRVFTARVCCPSKRRIATRAIGDWCERNGLPRLAVTNAKDFQMIELWDDRAVRVETNVGRRTDERAAARPRRRQRRSSPSAPVPATRLLTAATKAKPKTRRPTGRQRTNWQFGQRP